MLMQCENPHRQGNLVWGCIMRTVQRRPLDLSALFTAEARIGCTPAET